MRTLKIEHMPTCCGGSYISSSASSVHRSHHGIFALASCLLVALYFAVVARPVSTLWLASAMAASALLIRLVFFTMLIAMMSWAQPRYIQSFAPFLVPMALTAAAAAFAGRRLRSSYTLEDLGGERVSPGA